MSRCGAVVDYKTGLGVGEFSERLREQPISRRTLARFKVILQIR